MEWPVIVHPTALIDYESAQIGEGSFIGARCVSTVNLVLEPFALCNFGTTIGHETRIGRGSVVNPGANLSGGVVIEDDVLIGTGAQVLQYLKVGSGAVVGAGAVVTRDVPQRATVVGIPARARSQEGQKRRIGLHAANLTASSGNAMTSTGRSDPNCSRPAKNYSFHPGLI